MKAVEILASSLAIAIENARAFERVQELNRTKDTLLGEALARLSEYLREHGTGYGQAHSDGRFLIVNPALARILNYPTPEHLLKLQVPDDLFPSPEQWQRLVEALECGDDVTDWEAQLGARGARL
jgi:PAS domain-containing protein